MKTTFPSLVTRALLHQRIIPSSTQTCAIHIQSRLRHTLYTPPAALIDHFDSLPLTQHLRKHTIMLPYRPSLQPLPPTTSPEYQTFLPLFPGLGIPKHTAIPESPSSWSTHLTRGPTLYGRHKIEHVVQSFSEADNVLVTLVRFGTRVSGHPGILHGGMTSAFFDGVFGMLFMIQTKGIGSGVTANLSVDFRMAVEVGTDVAVVCWVESVDGRKVRLRGEMRSVGIPGGGSREGETVGERWAGDESIKYADATALFIKLDNGPVGNLTSGGEN
ncbi:Thioesterase super member 4 [Podochytrium sp. JEL0797]|nr:Thioesterase super member 4 [Podochytrium sp. JEL0797]